MKKLFTFALLLFILPIFAKAQIENVIVENYYTSDAKDATDTTGGRMLEQGSITYRVYIVLKPSYKLKKIYGDADHSLIISSTESFYNNTDRPAAVFGYQINKAWFTSNPTLGLDSWLTIGLATKGQAAVEKTDDTNGSFIGGLNNNGGTANITGGLLVNKSLYGGIPLTTSDGMMPDNTNYVQWLDNGFKDLSGIDTTIFGSVNTGKTLISNNIYLQQNSGVSSILPSSKILVAQLTTSGQIAFQLNIEVVDSLGNVTKCVAKDPKPNELTSAFLTYPLPCGCKDARYLEYKSSYGCDSPDSCKTLIVFGCMDPLSCSYDPSANVNLPELCCYPGKCNDRDISKVCPSLTKNTSLVPEFQLFPNPAHDHMAVRIVVPEGHVNKYEIYDMLGRKIQTKYLSVNITDVNAFDADLSDLVNGIYILKLDMNEGSYKLKFIKK